MTTDRERMIKSGFKDRYFTLGLAGAIISVLIILGILQYRWSNQVSEANEAQIGANLRSLMMDWHFDLFRDFSSIAVALQVGPDSGARDNWKDYLARYAEWQDSTSDPGIVDNVFLWESSAGPDARLLLLDTDHTRITESAIPADMRLLLDFLRSNSASLQAGLNAWAANSLLHPRRESQPGEVRPDPMTGWQFDPDIPALAHPVVHHSIPGEHSAASAKTVDWIVIRFSRNTLRADVLPRLSSRFFGGEHGLDYRVEVISTSDQQTSSIYSSEASESGKAVNHPDAEMNIFGIPPESTEGVLMQGPRTDSMVRSPNWRKFSAPSWFPVLKLNGDRENWILRVQHRRGSFAGIVAGIRRRNLAISFGVLILLAISMSLVVLASYRAQKFARLQMNFVAAVSHELRTPLAVISSAAENIADGVVSGNKLTKYASAIRNQTFRLTELVEDILSFAASHNGNLSYRLKVIDVTQIIRSALENTQELLDRDGFTVEQEIEPRLPMVRGDVTALRQCLQNLIVNAIKYSGQSRWIGIYARTGRDHAGYLQVHITVEDHGPGIAGSEIKQIFEPFYRAQAARDAQIRGTGLGLTLARTIAEEMGGTLTVTTKVEHGSAFTLHLPPVLDQTNIEVPPNSVPEPIHKA